MTGAQDLRSAMNLQVENPDFYLHFQVMRSYKTYKRLKPQTLNPWPLDLQAFKPKRPNPLKPWSALKPMPKSKHPLWTLVTIDNLLQVLTILRNPNQEDFQTTSGIPNLGAYTAYPSRDLLFVALQSLWKCPQKPKMGKMSNIPEAFLELYPYTPNPTRKYGAP